MKGGRRGLLAAIAGTLFALIGTALIVVAATSQEHAPQPPGPAAESSARENRRPTSNPVPLVLPRSKPVAIDIPAIGVHSSLVSLGLNADSTVQVPSAGSYDEAGWYRYSPPPGSLGPAVILGHVDSAARGPSVFFRLGDLRSGDKVMVTRRDGSVAVFEVNRVRRYPKTHFPTKLVYGNTKNAALRLITCGGSFNFSTRHYVDNIIAFASLIGPTRSNPAGGRQRGPTSGPSRAA
jgi:sortase (surface protein transpeptidase)